MQLIKVKADCLAFLGSTVHPKDLTDIVLDELTGDYKFNIETTHGHDNPKSFAGLHEKLINRELAIMAAARLSPRFPIKVNHSQQRPMTRRQTMVETNIALVTKTTTTMNRGALTPISNVVKPMVPKAIL